MVHDFLSSKGKLSSTDLSISKPGLFVKYKLKYIFVSLFRLDDWFVAWSLEIPGANGQGHSADECRVNLGAAIQLNLEDRCSVLEICRN
jgi:predicted RNase H-like HicB family nuclease